MLAATVAAATLWGCGTSSSVESATVAQAVPAVPQLIAVSRPDAPEALGWASDGGLLISAEGGLYRATTGRPKRFARFDGTYAAVSPDGRLVASLDNSPFKSTISIRSYSTGRVLARSRPFKTSTLEQPRLLGAADGQPALYDLATQQVTPVPLPATSSYSVWSPDSMRLASIRSDDVGTARQILVEVVDAQTGTTIARLPASDPNGDGSGDFLTWSPDGNRIALSTFAQV